MVNEGAQQVAQDDAANEPEAVDEAVANADIPVAETNDMDETVEENPLASIDESAPEAAEEAAMHVDTPEEEAVAEAALEAADEQVDAPAQPTATSGNKKMRWYIIHAYSGFEKKVAMAIKESAAQKGLSDKFEDVVVPTEEIVEVRRGKKVQAERKFFPGYVLAKMEMSDATWQLVKTTDKVTGFLGGGGTKPQPITEAEANAIFQQVQAGIDAPKRAINFDIGEQVKVIDGPFDSFIGTVEDIDEEKEKLKVSVSIFGRPTPVELEFSQVDKV